jgi:hypothetical protein
MIHVVQKLHSMISDMAGYRFFPQEKGISSHSNCRMSSKVEFVTKTENIKQIRRMGEYFGRNNASCIFEVFEIAAGSVYLFQRW